MKRIYLFFIAVSLSIPASAQTLPVSNWTYIQVDDAKGKWGDMSEPKWLRYFGLDMGDVNGDDYLDILSGRYIYHNPGGDMTGPWKRSEFPVNGDGILLLNVDGDEYADAIAQALPEVLWFEATDKEGTKWKVQKIGEIPATSHTNSQGFEKGQLVKGGKEEFVIAGNGNIYLFEVPADPTSEDWGPILVAENTSDEGIGLGDIDGDGDLDIAAGRRPEGGDEPLIMVWFQNPGSKQSSWKDAEVGKSNHPVDRVEVGDLNGDGRADIVVAEERYPGLEPDGTLFWYEQPEANDAKWSRHAVVTQYSMNNLDVADLDADGDLDLVTNMHKGPTLETQLWQNDGSGNFTKQTIDFGKENHLGTQLADLDMDGDLDLVGAGWDHSQYMHVWRNEYLDDRFTWKHLSTIRNELPGTNGGTQQTASLAADINGDGANDVFITDRTTSPSVVGMIYSEGKWVKHIIDADSLRIEAGSAAHDIDGDGDLDLVFGGESRSNEIWWWENPFPNIDPSTPWTRRTIKKSGKNKHHDQGFIDYDGDGQKELVFWNQRAATLYCAEVPSNPKQVDEWDYQPIYQYTTDGEMEPRSIYPGFHTTHEHEGLFALDMNDDGVDDIVAGGRWFQYDQGAFRVHIVDASYTFTRSVAGQLIEGGRPEVVMVVGDGLGPMTMYEWNDGNWVSTVLIDSVDNGHTLEIVDFNGDGHLDLFNAEMRFGEGNPDSEVRILLGDGKGHFSKHVVARGNGVHEGKIVDLDGDGDLDILGKPYTWETPRWDVWINESK